MFLRPDRNKSGWSPVAPSGAAARRALLDSALDGPSDGGGRKTPPLFSGNYVTQSEHVDTCLCPASTSKPQSKAAKLAADAAEGSWKCIDRLCPKYGMQTARKGGPHDDIPLESGRAGINCGQRSGGSHMSRAPREN